MSTRSPTWTVHSGCIAAIGRQVYVTLPIRPWPRHPRRTLPLFPIPTFLSGASNTAAVGAIGLRPVDDRLAALSYAVLAEARGKVRVARRRDCWPGRVSRTDYAPRDPHRRRQRCVAASRRARRLYTRPVAVDTGRIPYYAPFAGAARDEVFYVLGVTG